MSRVGRTVSGVLAGYLVIGLIVHLVQAFTGAVCNTLLGERHATGRPSMAMTALLWGSDLAGHVGSGQALSEYLAPSRCVGAQ